MAREKNGSVTEASENIVALIRVARNTFRIPIGRPRWLTPLVSQGKIKGGRLIFNDELSFLGNFLSEAEEAWAAAKAHKCESGVLEWRNDKGVPEYVKVSAGWVNDQPSLIVELQEKEAHRTVKVARRALLELEQTYSSLAIKAQGAQETDVRPGALLQGVYRVGSLISEGAMGQIYQGLDERLERVIAIKVMHTSLVGDTALTTRFKNEARMLAAVKHPNLVQIFSLGDGKTTAPYFIMEYIDGVSLGEKMQIATELNRLASFVSVSRMIREISGALFALHKKNVVHRDVKPDNILIDTSLKRSALVDVGVSKWVGERGDAAGTPGFAAPESLSGGAETSSTDVYGLACTAYYALTGSVPFVGETVSEIYKKQIEHEPPSVQLTRPELPAELDELFMIALQPLAGKRYSDVIAFSDALTRLVPTAGRGTSDVELYDRQS